MSSPIQAQGPQNQANVSQAGQPRVSFNSFITTCKTTIMQKAETVSNTIKEAFKSIKERIGQRQAGGGQDSAPVTSMPHSKTPKMDLEEGVSGHKGSVDLPQSKPPLAATPAKVESSKVETPRTPAPPLPAPPSAPPSQTTSVAEVQQPVVKEASPLTASDVQEARPAVTTARKEEFAVTSSNRTPELLTTPHTAGQLDALKKKVASLPGEVDNVKLVDLKELLNYITKSTSGDRIRFLEGEVDKMIETSNSIKQIKGEMDQIQKESGKHISTRYEAQAKAQAILTNKGLPDGERDKARKDYRSLSTDIAESQRVQSSEITRCKREIEPLRTQLSKLDVFMRAELLNEKVAYVQDRLQNIPGGAVDLNSVKNAFPLDWFQGKIKEMISCSPGRLDELNALLKSELAKKQAQ